MPFSAPKGWSRRLRDSLKNLPPPTASPGDVIGRYRLLKVIGQGAMGVVYEAEDATLNRRVALKILRDSAGAQLSNRERFLREAQAAARLAHPNVVTIHEVGEDGGRMFLVMELVDGEPLDSLLELRPHGIRDAAGFMAKVALGVHHAHERGIVHRDLKPGNILVATSGEPKVADFGLAHLSDSSLTRSGATMGTPLYMAPEQIGGQAGDITPRTDVYALGAILYEMVTGRPPITAPSATELYARIVKQDPAPARSVNPRVPPDLEAITMKAIEKIPMRRYPSAAALAEDLRRYVAGESVTARPVTRATRLWRRAGRHKAVLIPGATILVAALVFGVWGMVNVSRVGRERQVRDESLRLLEAGRPAIDQASQILYSREASYEELIRRVDEGQRLIERAIEKSPELALGHFLLGRAWEIKGHDDKAEACWKRALDLDPGFGPARFHRGRLLLLRSVTILMVWQPEERDMLRPESVRLALQGAEDLREALVPGKGLTDPLQQAVAAAGIAYANEDRAGAARIASEAIERFKGVAGVEECHWLLSRVHRLDEAIADLDRALTVRPKFPLALFTRASAREQKQDFIGAEADYDEAIRYNPRLTAAWVNRGILKAARGDHKAAVADYTEAVRIMPGSFGTFLNRALAWEALGEPPKALADYSESLAVNPRFAVAWMNRGNLRSAGGDVDGALSDLAEAIAVKPDYALAYYNRGNVHRSRKDPDLAIRDYGDAIRLQPKFPEALFNRGLARFDRNDVEGAVADLESALEQAPADWRDRATAQRSLEFMRSRIR